MITTVNTLMLLTFLVGVCIGMTATFIMYEIVRSKFRKTDSDGDKTDSKD